MKTTPMRRYLRPDALPHFFCPGCGAAQVMNYFVRAADAANLDFDRLVAIGGVGCSARIPVYLDADALHGVHGRTLAWATGIKLHNPELQVVIFAGDGDAVAIGGNHFIHAARRNLDALVIVVNNLTFAMTGGQVAPTTFSGMRTLTTPYGSIEPPFDVCRLALAAGATFVSRWSTHRPGQAIAAIKNGLAHRGFSVVEVVTQCPTNFGRRALGTGDCVESLKWIEENSVVYDPAQHDVEQWPTNTFVLGNFHQEDRPIFEGSSMPAERKGPG